MQTRFALALTALLGAATQRACGPGSATAGGAIVAPWEEACRGRSCGDSCGYCPADADPASCPVPTVAPTACNVRGQCATAGTFLCEGETCTKRACGVSCDGPCPYGTPCPAPVVCDGNGSCGPAPGPCTASPAPLPACGTANCGDPCAVEPPCRATGCLAPARLGRCDDSGQCVPLPALVVCAGGDPACAGKACGEDCDTCGGACAHPYATACDLAGRCLPEGPYLCYDPCAGLACGAPCRLCPPGATDCVESALARACDRQGVCAPAPATCP